MIKRLSDMEQFVDGSGGGNFVVVPDQLKDLFDTVVDRRIKPAVGQNDFFFGDAVEIGKEGNGINHRPTECRCRRKLQGIQQFPGLQWQQG